VTDGGPADDAGIRAGDDRESFQARAYEVGGDVITRVQGQPVEDPKELSDRLLDFRPDDVVTLTVLRDGKERAVRVRLRERPNDASG
jgi:S1-C subfamily serine protease